MWNLWIASLSIEILLIIGLILVSCKNRQIKASYQLLALLNSVLVIIFSYLMELISPDFSSKLFWYKLRGIGIACYPVFWFLMSQKYKTRIYKKNALKDFWFFIVPGMCLVFSLTLEHHHLFWESYQLVNINQKQFHFDPSYGIVFWIFTIYSYTMLTLGCLQFLYDYVQSLKLAKRQPLVFLIGGLLPWIANYLYLINISPIYDFSYVFVILACILFSMGLYRLNYLDISPIASNLVLNEIQDLVIVTDQNDTIAEANLALLQFLNLDKSFLLGNSIHQILDKYNIQCNPIEPIIKSEERTKLIIKIENLGTIVYFECSISPINVGNQKFGTFYLLHDVTANRMLEEELRQKAHYDYLTQLPNRSYFQECFNQKVNNLKQFNNHLALIYCDIDDFKQVNDTFGHHIGDVLLKNIAHTLSENIREFDLAARLAGDEFVILLDNIENQQQIQHVSNRIFKKLKKGFTVDGQTIIATMSMGAAIYPQDGKTLPELLTHADRMLYEAKADGKSLLFLTSEYDNQQTF